MAKIIIRKGFISNGGHLYKAGDVVTINDAAYAKRIVARSGGDFDFYHGEDAPAALEEATTDEQPTAAENEGGVSDSDTEADEAGGGLPDIDADADEQPTAAENEGGVSDSDTEADEAGGGLPDIDADADVQTTKPGKGKKK